MLEHFIASLLPEIISLLELIGIIVISCGAVKAFYYYIHSFFTKKRYPIRIELAMHWHWGWNLKWEPKF